MIGIKSVDNILAVFTKTIDQLSTVATKLETRAFEADTKAYQLNVDAKQDRQEAIRARAIVDNLTEIVSE